MIDRQFEVTGEAMEPFCQLVTTVSDNPLAVLQAYFNSTAEFGPRDFQRWLDEGHGQPLAFSTAYKGWTTMFAQIDDDIGVGLAAEYSARVSRSGRIL